MPFLELQEALARALIRTLTMKTQTASGLDHVTPMTMVLVLILMLPARPTRLTQMPRVHLELKVARIMMLMERSLAHSRTFLMLQLSTS